MHTYKGKNRKSFTLIELLVVIAIIGLLSSVILVNLSGPRQKARITKALEFSQSVQHAIGVEAVGIWDFDDCTAKDLSGYKNNGTINGAVCVDDTPYKVVGSGQGKNALSFDGGDDYVNVSSANLGLTNKFTFSVWTKIPSSETDGHIIVIDSAGLIRVRLLAQQTIIWQIVANSNVISIGSEINNNSWHYIAGTYDGSVQKIYVDGIEKDSDTNSGNIGSGGTNIGAASNGGYLNGLIDEVRIYATALTLGQIQDLYLAGLEKHQQLTMD